MKNHAAEFRRCLTDLDTVGIRRLWKHVRPGLPQPKDDGEALITLHMARTAALLPIKLRCYSHAWLIERGLPSQLPDQLKRHAERLYPRKVDAVGVSVNSLSTIPEQIERARAAERAGSNAVAECYADGVKDVDVIRGRIREAIVKEASH